jgi:hypothetical protein
MKLAGLEPATYWVRRRRAPAVRDTSGNLGTKLRLLLSSSTTKYEFSRILGADDGTRTHDLLHGKQTL